MEFTNRRALLLMGAATIGGMGMGGASTCSSTALDPVAIANDIRIACGIAVVASSVATVINAAAGMSASAIISLICSSFKNAQAGLTATGVGGGPGTEVRFTVHVCDANHACKDIPMFANRP